MGKVWGSTTRQAFCHMLREAHDEFPNQCPMVPHLAHLVLGLDHLLASSRRASSLSPRIKVTGHLLPKTWDCGMGEGVQEGGGRREEGEHFNQNFNGTKPDSCKAALGCILRLLQIHNHQAPWHPSPLHNAETVYHTSPHFFRQVKKSIFRYHGHIL